MIHYGFRGVRSSSYKDLVWYIGSTDKRGITSSSMEIVDNSVDEVVNGYGNEIDVTITIKMVSISIEDNDVVMPTGIHTSGKPGQSGYLHCFDAGGKSRQGGYKTSGWSPRRWCFSW